MSSGKVRRERSSSRERHYRKEGDKRIDSSRRDKPSEVRELNEEEYDEGWEHEWEDIDELDRGNARFQKSYGKNQHQKWRGKNQYRGHIRFNKWDHRNHSVGSEHGSDASRKAGRKNFIEDDETLEMSAGVEITNLKVKIQDGKRFAEPDEFDDIEFSSKLKYQPRFVRGRGSRGYHGAGRERWNQGPKHKHLPPDDVVDCREVLNRRKRHYSDNNESDLREKLLRKEEMGDLREIIESRDPALADLRDIIEPPDMSMMDEFTDEIVGNLDMMEDINLSVHNEYFVDRSERHRELDQEPEREPLDEEIDHFKYQEEHDIPPHDEIQDQDVEPPRSEGWREDRWQERRERSFEPDRWSDKNRRETFEEEWRPRRHDSPIDRNTTTRGHSPEPRVAERALSRNQSSERPRSPFSRARRGRSFDVGSRPRDASWERDRPFGFASPRERDSNLRMEHGGRGSFNKAMSGDERSFSPGGRMIVENQRRPLPPVDEVRRLMRSPQMEPDRRREREIEEQRMRSISQENSRMIEADRKRESSERRRMRREMGRENQERNFSVGLERGGVRSPRRERIWVPNREGRERNNGSSRDGSGVFEQDVHRGFEGERNRSLNQERKRSVEQNAHWDQTRSVSRDRSLRLQRVLSPGRERERERDRRSGWVGPRTPSEDSFREAGWDRSRSPPRSRGRSPPRERSGSRGRLGAVPTDRPGREIQERGREMKNKPQSRPKEPELKEKPQEQSRRREYDQGKSQDMQSNRPRDKDSKRKREHEEPASKDRVRGRPRSPERHSPTEKITKKTPQMLIEEFKERYVRQNDKPSKFSRREEFPPKQGRDSSSQGGGHNQQDSREWENIRDFQERRGAQPVVGVPFLDGARRPRENFSREQHLQNQNQQGGRGPRNVPVAFVRESQGNQGNQGNYQHKEQPPVWQSQNTQHQFNPHEDDRRRHSRWGSPGRDKLSSHSESHKSGAHPPQSAPSHPPSNGKPDADFWRRNLPSLGDSQWIKPRSDLSTNPSRDMGVGSQRPASSFTKSAKGHQSAKEVIFIRGLARDISDMDIRKDISDCGLWPKDVRVVTDSDTGASRGLAFITFNSVDEATRWMDLRGCVLNLRPNNHAAMDYSNPITRDWECIRCHTMNFKHRAICYQCNREKEDCLDGWEETCPYPTNALILRGLNPLSSISDITKALKSRMVAQARLDGVKMGVDAKGRPRSVCFVQLTSVTDSMSLHKSLVNEPLIIDNCQVSAAYCQLDKLPLMEPHISQMHPAMPILTPSLPSAIPLTIQPPQPSLPANNIPVVSRPAPAIPPPPKPAATPVSTTTIRSMLEGNYTEKDIPTLAQYCASAYAKNPQEQSAYVRYYTKHYREKLLKGQAVGK